MPKRTAIIDIGSNSARVVIFEKTSHYGFHLICEQKSKVRLGEGAYEKEGYLQPIPIKRAFLTLQSFLQTIQKYQVEQTICVATSALRDAPNANVFIQWIKQTLDLEIKVIDGEQEAYYGAVAANTLLPIQEGISIDIGGGSSDMALIQNGHIVDTYSLNLGTVRLKELFFDKEISREKSIQEASIYIESSLKKLPKHFKHPLAIGIGGTARTLSRGIMRCSSHPLDKLHAFTYTIDDFSQYLECIPYSSAKNLKEFEIKKNRFDTIREGTLIFNAILAHIDALSVISSAVGVREGVFLSYLLKSKPYLFPTNINPSIVSILDRFKPYVDKEEQQANKLKIATSLYDTFQDLIMDNKQYSNLLMHALQLSSIGKTLTIYKSHQHAFYIAMQELNYGFTHKEILLISLLLRMHGKALLHKPLFQSFESLLPPKQTLLWLSFIYTLTVFIYEASNDAEISFVYKNTTLTIYANTSLYLAREKIKSLEKPLPFAIIIEDEENVLKCKALGI